MTFWKGKKVFVSGGAGVIGTALVRRLQAAGATVWVGDLKPKPDSWTSDIQYRQGDLNTLTRDEVESFGANQVFHLAATFERSIESYGFFEENFHHNILLSHHLLSLFKDLKPLQSIVFASSYLIYDPSLYLFPQAQSRSVVLKESDRIAPRNLCGMAKLQHEQELAFLKSFRNDLQIVCARIFRCYGHGSRDIISRWINAVTQWEEITVYRPEGRFDYVFADDVAQGLMLLAESGKSGAVNLGSGRSRSVAEVVALLEKQFGPIRVKNEPSDIAYEASEADMTLFHDWTGHRLNFRPLEETLYRT